MNLNKLKIIEKKEDITFGDIKHIDSNRNEYWFARELMLALEYTKWENFHKVIKNAMISCENSNYSVVECFPDLRKTSKMPNGGVKNMDQFHNAGYKGLYNGDL